MHFSSRPGRVAVWLLSGLAVLIVIAIGAIVIREDHVSAGHADSSFTVDCEFSKFRQIMVRKDATNAIVNNNGMKLISEKVEGIDLDLSGDERPLLNAIRGKSKSELTAKKELTVELNDPELEAGSLVLKQEAEIEEHRIHVNTESKGPAGHLERYETTLNAIERDDKTQVTLTVDLNVRVNVPMLFASAADKQVQQAADKGLQEQRAAIEQFISSYADAAVILPKLKRE